MTTGIIVARRLGPELRGYYGMILMAASMITAFGHLGIGAAIAYHTGRRTHRREEILTFLIMVSFGLGTALTALFLAFYERIPDIWADIPRPLMLIGLVAVPFTFLHNFLHRFLLAMLRVAQSNISNLLQTVLYLALVLGIVLVAGGMLRGVVVAHSVSIIAASIISLLVFTRDIRPLGRLRLSLLAPFVAYGLQVYAIFVFNYLNHRFDILLIRHYLTPSDVSFYQIPVNLCERLWQIPHAMAAVLFPTLLALERGSAEFTARVCRSNFLLMIVLGAAIVASAWLFIPLLYGREYLPMLPALYSVLWGIVIAPVAIFLGVYFASRRQVSRNIIASGSGFACNIALNIVLIPRLGIVGAGIATSISNTLWALILAWFFIRQERIGLREIFVFRKSDFGDLRDRLRRAVERRRLRGPGEDGRPPAGV